MGWLARAMRENITTSLSLTVFALLIAMALLAPWIAGDPNLLTAGARLKVPDAHFWFGTDHLGRNIFDRAVYGARVSLIVGVGCATLAVALGLLVGMLCGFYRWIDAFLMRIMDGIMAIPAILLAIALTALLRPSLATVLIAIVVPEIPRTARLVRSIVLTLREQTFVQSAIVSGSSDARILLRHILPNTVAPMIVQATYVSAAAILTEAGLSFLGAGVPPEMATWGNVIASGRSYFLIAPWIIFFPGLLLALTVLSINLLGDSLRDTLDPRLARNMR
jgi:peptide/nickel transport system permease protein